MPPLNPDDRQDILKDIKASYDNMIFNKKIIMWEIIYQKDRILYICPSSAESPNFNICLLLYIFIISHSCHLAIILNDYI
jgi:hypothetical protein